MKVYKNWAAIYYNKTYERKRDALIPEAEKIANLHYGKKRRKGMSKEAWDIGWSKVFSQTMDRLTLERGLKA